MRSAIDLESIGEYEKSLRNWDMSIEIDTTDCGWLYWRRARVKWRLKDIEGEIKDNLYALDRNLDCDLLPDKNFDYG